MIDGFNEIQKEYSDIQLVLAGEGELEKKIKNKVKNLNLDNKIIFIGYKKMCIVICINQYVFYPLHYGKIQAL